MNTRSFRRAFTLLEVMLAAVLGSILILGALALFGTIDSADKRQQIRFQNTMEFTTTHRVLTQAFRSLLMTAEPEPNNDDMQKRIESDLRSATGSDAELISDEPGQARFSLQPITGLRDIDGHPMQSLEVTLRTAPIRGGLTPVAPSSDLLDRYSQAFGDRSSSGSSSRSDKSSSRDSDYAALDSSSGSAGATGAQASGAKPGQRVDSRLPADRSTHFTTARTRSDRSLQSRLEGLSIPGLANIPPSANLSNPDTPPTVDAPRAPGVRGVFEVRPQQSAGISTVALNSAGQPRPLELWWREIPSQIDVTAAEDARQLDPTLPHATGREIRLLSNLASARWQVYRRREFYSKMTASWLTELPAYVELRVETLDGRRENWMFEVAWSQGPEPGSILVDQAGPLDLALLADNNPPTTGDGGGGGTDKQTIDPATGLPTTDTKGSGKGGKGSGKGGGRGKGHSPGQPVSPNVPATPPGPNIGSPPVNNYPYTDGRTPREQTNNPGASPSERDRAIKEELERNRRIRSR